ncbi:hypothetical protein [Streptomyces sp. AB3(2024)]|uniref:hypothetical protein n=1 Tax=Streptomyces sp. AB3(2024) TaxID=3317321 RepID=UPI0035A2FD1C
MSRRPRVPPARPGPPWASAVLGAVPAVLLLAALVCFPHLLDGAGAPGGTRHEAVSAGSRAAGAAPQSGPTVPEGRPHPHPEHGSSCSAVPGTSRTAPGPARDGGGQAARGLPGRGAGTRAGPAVPTRHAGAPRARSGRSVLTSVCRWRL